MKKFRKGFAVLLALVLAFTLAACGGGQSTGDSGQKDAGQKKEGDKAAGKEYSIKEIKISHVVAEKTPKHQGALAMKKYIEEASGGKIEVKVFPNSSLYGDKDEYENLVANNVQFIIPDMAKLTKYVPAFDMASMPFVFSSEDAAVAFWDGEQGQKIMKDIEKEGVVALKMWPNGFKQFTNNKVLIKKPEDFKGLKIRTQSGQVLADIYDVLDAGAASIPFSELYTALQQGTVDGQENTFSNIESKKLDEVQKYMTVTNHNRVDYALLTNTKFWDSLDEETKKIVQGGIDAGTKFAREQAKSLNENAYKLLKERGKVEIYELNDAEIKAFRDAFKPIYDKYTPIFGEAVIKDAMSR